MDDLVKNILIMAALLALSAYFSATETAFNSMNRTRVRAMAEKGDKDAELALKLSENYDRLLSTILVGNNIVRRKRRGHLHRRRDSAGAHIWRDIAKEPRKGLSREVRPEISRPS